MLANAACDRCCGDRCHGPTVPSRIIKRVGCVRSCRSAKIGLRRLDEDRFPGESERARERFCGADNVPGCFTPADERCERRLRPGFACRWNWALRHRQDLAYTPARYRKCNRTRPALRTAFRAMRSSRPDPDGRKLGCAKALRHACACLGRIAMALVECRHLLVSLPDLKVDLQATQALQCGLSFFQQGGADSGSPV